MLFFIKNIILSGEIILIISQYRTLFERGRYCMNLKQSFLENRVAIPAFRDATSINKNQHFSLQSSRFVTSFALKLRF